MMKGFYVLFCLCLLFQATSSMSSPSKGFYYKQKLGLVLQIDGYNWTHSVNLPGKSWSSSYDIDEMVITDIHVGYYPLASRDKHVKCWILHGGVGNYDGLLILTQDRNGNLKCLCNDIGDIIHMKQWRKGVFTVSSENPGDGYGFIMSTHKASWDRKAGVFMRSNKYEDISEVDKWSLKEIFTSACINYTLKNGRRAVKGNDTLIRFTPSGYIRKRLPNSLRDTPCVQAKIVNGNTADSNKATLKINKCSPYNDNGLTWQR